MALEAVHELEIQTMHCILIEILGKFDKSFEIYWILWIGHKGVCPAYFLHFLQTHCGIDRTPGAPSHS